MCIGRQTPIPMSDQITDRTFIIVKYGDNQEALFNPWCSTLTLLHWIRKKCNCDRDIVIDLVDLEGQIRNLSTVHSWDYANELVTGRETYILIRVEKQSEGPHQYVSLLNNLEDTNPELVGKLNSMSARPPTRNKSRSKGKNAKQTKGRGESASKRPTSGERRKSYK